LTFSALLPFAIKATTGALVTFLAILAWSKTREFSWTCICAAVVIRFAGTLSQMLCVLGLIALPEAKVFDLNALDMFFTLAPSLLFGAAFISVIFTS